MKKIRLNLTGQPFSYEIVIGYDLLAGMGERIEELNIARHYVVITDSNVSSLYGGALLEKLREKGFSASMIAFPAGEASKNIATALSLTRQLLELGADRKSALLALGGGVVGDMVGFVASLYMRSIPYIQIPTTLVAQVDSSIGGKTAIDLEEGKNLLGAFYQPRAVLTDPAFLATLPEGEFANGLAEIVKYAIIDPGGLFELLEGQIQAVKGRKQGILLEVIGKSCEIKKELVEIDERDEGPRRFLNFGHTLGHALEAASGYTLSHGQAISLGMIAAIRLSEKICGLPQVQGERMECLIRNAGLPTVIPRGMSTDLIMAKLKMDKKKSGSTINFVLIKKPGEPFVSGLVSEKILRETVEELGK